MMFARIEVVDGGRRTESVEENYFWWMGVKRNCEQMLRLPGVGVNGIYYMCVV